MKQSTVLFREQVRHSSLFYLAFVSSYSLIFMLLGMEDLAKFQLYFLLPLFGVKLLYTHQHYKTASLYLSMLMFSLLTSNLYFWGWHSGFQFYLLNFIPLAFLWSIERSAKPSIYFTPLLILGLFSFSFEGNAHYIALYFNFELVYLNAIFSLLYFSYQISSLNKIPHSKPVDSPLRNTSLFTADLAQKKLESFLSELQHPSSELTLVLCSLDKLQGSKFENTKYSQDQQNIIRFIQKRIASKHALIPSDEEEIVLIFPNKTEDEVALILHRICFDLNSLKQQESSPFPGISLRFSYTTFQSYAQFRAAFKQCERALYPQIKKSNQSVILASQTQP